MCEDEKVVTMNSFGPQATVRGAQLLPVFIKKRDGKNEKE